MDWKYWGKPVPNLGDKNAEILIIGLAPAAHGANRTGQMFTGDNSGLWLFRALHQNGLSNMINSSSRTDGLKLKNTLISSVCHCAPPENKPTPKEISNCLPYFEQTFRALKPKVTICLGGLAWNQLFKFLKEKGLWKKARPKFGHLAVVKLPDGTSVIGSYHPSQHNTFTGRLTEDMFSKVFKKAKALC